MKNGNYGPATKKRYREEAMAHSKPGLLIWRLRQRWERYSYEKNTVHILVSRYLNTLRTGDADLRF